MPSIKEVLLAFDKMRLRKMLLSQNDISSILEATKTISENKDLIKALLDFWNSLKSNSEFDTESLTPREIDILSLVGKAMHNHKIASELNIKTSTVETHRKNIIKKLGLTGKGKLLEFAILYNLQPKLSEFNKN